MAIVMLNFFDPKELGLQSWAVFAPRDVASFANAGATALRVANECLDKFSQSNETGEAASTLGFTSAMGYGSIGERAVLRFNSNRRVHRILMVMIGMSGAIGVFFWATGSEIDTRVRSGISRKGVLQAFNLSTKADAVG